MGRGEENMGRGGMERREMREEEVAGEGEGEWQR